MKQVPHMHHLGPDLQINVNVGGACRFGEGQRVIKQCLGSADLYQ